MAHLDFPREDLQESRFLLHVTSGVAAFSQAVSPLQGRTVAVMVSSVAARLRAPLSFSTDTNKGRTSNPHTQKRVPNALEVSHIRN